MLAIAAYVVLGLCWMMWSLAFVKPRKRAAGAKKNASAQVSRWNSAGDAWVSVHLGFCAADGI